jgi:hypothetical protein
MICRPRKPRGGGPIGSRSAGVSRRSSDPCTIEGIEAGPKHTSGGPLILVIAVLSFDHNTLVEKGETGSARVAVR